MIKFGHDSMIIQLITLEESFKDCVCRLLPVSTAMLFFDNILEAWHGLSHCPNWCWKHVCWRLRDRLFKLWHRFALHCLEFLHATRLKLEYISFFCYEIIFFHFHKFFFSFNHCWHRFCTLHFSTTQLHRHLLNHHALRLWCHHGLRFWCHHAHRLFRHPGLRSWRRHALLFWSHHGHLWCSSTFHSGSITISTSTTSSFWRFAASFQSSNIWILFVYYWYMWSFDSLSTKLYSFDLFKLTNVLVLLFDHTNHSCRVTEYLVLDR